MNRVGELLGNYRLSRPLGQGGFAVVYLGEHRYLGTQAAVKVLQTNVTGKEEADFLQEARIIACLTHPHIVRVLDFGVQQGLPFLVMEYAQGGTLRQRHPSGVRVALHDAVGYTSQAANALQYAHDQGVVHRDMKPDNLLLNSSSQIILSDFGIAVLVQTSGSQHTREVVGTAAYMAPEQFKGRPVQASDQYSLAVIVYEWLTGVRPFRGTFAEIASGHLYNVPPPLRQINPLVLPEVELVVLKALEKDPRHRFASVRQFADMLERAAGVQLGSPVSPPVPEIPADAVRVLRAYAGVDLPEVGDTRTVASVRTRANDMSSEHAQNVGKKMLSRRATWGTQVLCSGIVVLSVLLWSFTFGTPSWHTGLGLIVLLSLVLWIASYADYRRSLESPRKVRKSAHQR